MKKITAYLLILMFFAVLNFWANAHAQQQIPEGMEAIRLGGSAELIVPEGAKTRQVGAQVIVEGTKEYMSRRFSEMEKRLATMEERLETLTKEVESLKSTENQKAKSTGGTE